MRRAIEIAINNGSSTDGGPFGAVIVKNGEVISSAGNSVTVDNDPTAHAEVNAIRAAAKMLNSFDLSGSTLYTSCEPCPMCLAAAYWANIDKIYYSATKDDAAAAGFDDSFIYDELALSHSERRLPIEQLLKESGVEPFDLWGENEEKISY